MVDIGATCCCCFSDKPLTTEEQEKNANGAGRKYREHGGTFQTDMTKACCVDMPNSCFWCICGFALPPCTQCRLRYKVLGNDSSKYSCFQGQFSICCGMIKAGSCNESSCPDLCMCCEVTLCPGLAVSASRMTIMDQYDLRSDPCDHRLIRFSNCMQMLSCVCWVLAFIDNQFMECARIIDLIADIIFHTVSGCMTAQVAYEMKYQEQQNAGQKLIYN